jgi:hypothetical protein
VIFRIQPHQQRHSLHVYSVQLESLLPRPVFRRHRGNMFGEVIDAGRELVDELDRLLDICVWHRTQR